MKLGHGSDSFKYFVVSGLNDIQYYATVVVLRFLQAQIKSCKMIQKVRYNPGHGITITGDYCID